MLKELQDVGLSEKEAKVYLAALDLGRSTADQLAKHAKIVRSTTYVQLESLMKKGLMSTYEEGKKTYFAPESPEYLKRIFELKKKEFEAKEAELGSFLPELLKKFEGAGERPLVRFFDGKVGIISLREEVLSSKKKDIFVISASDDLDTLFSRAELDEYTRRRKEKGFTTHLLYTKKEGRLPAPTNSLTHQAYINPEKMPLATDMVIFDDAVGIMTLKGHLHGTIVKSKDIHMSMLSIFKFLWSQAEKD